MVQVDEKTKLVCKPSGYAPALTQEEAEVHRRQARMACVENYRAAPREQRPARPFQMATAAAAAWSAAARLVEEADVRCLALVGER